jgi:hypothetical protein
LAGTRQAGVSAPEKCDHTRYAGIIFIDVEPFGYDERDHQHQPHWQKTDGIASKG